MRGGGREDGRGYERGKGRGEGKRRAFFLLTITLSHTPTLERERERETDPCHSDTTHLECLSRHRHQLFAQGHPHGPRLVLALEDALVGIVAGTQVRADRVHELRIARKGMNGAGVDVSVGREGRVQDRAGVEEMGEQAHATPGTHACATCRVPCKLPMHAPSPGTLRGSPLGACC